MKFEIEVDEKEFVDELRRKVKGTVINLSTSYAMEQYVADSVRQSMKNTIDDMVADELCNVEAIRAKVIAAIEKSLRQKINAAMKAAEKP